MLMTHTLAALLGTLALAYPAPVWQPDYATAYAQSSTAHKPLAVFIGHGSGGAGCVVSKGLTSEESRTLADKFVALYIDADTAEGKKVAGTFQLTEGLIISDVTGGLQALKHGGGLTHDELGGYLTKYSDPNRQVTTTDVGGTLKPAVVTYDPFTRYAPYGAKSSCPNCRN
jgi:hypothetical protein